jgi:hypothetical protein
MSISVWFGPPSGRFGAGSVDEVMAAQTSGPTLPSADRPCRCWNAHTACTVFVPNEPSIGPGS